MKKLWLLLYIIVLTWSCSSDNSEGPKDINVTAIRLSHDTIEIPIGHLELIQYFLQPSIATEVPKIKWIIDNEDIASGVEINNNRFEIYGMEVGETVISCFLDDRRHIADTCFIKIIPAPTTSIPATSIVLNTNDLNLYVGEDSLLTAKIYPEETTNKEIKWESSNPSIATVENGNIKALTAGETIITATSGDGAVKAECKVHVKNILVSKVYINEFRENNKIMIGSEIPLTYNILPENAFNKNVIITSSDESVVKIDENMRLYALSNGKATITINSEDGNAVQAYNIEVGDITLFVTTSISGSYVNIMGNVTGEIYCYLNNNSNYDIQAISLKVINGYDQVIRKASSDQLGIIKANSASNGLGGEFTNVYYPKFIWEYKYNDTVYTIEYDITNKQLWE